MGLVICPECNAEVSQYSESCPSCGFPIKNFMEDNKLTDINSVLICPKCSDIYFGFEKEYTAPYLKCRYCNTIVIQTNENSKELFRLFCNSNETTWENKIIELSNKYGNNQFNQEAYDKRQEIIEQQNIDRIRKLKKETQQNIPKCPTCGSINIKKIGTGERVTSVGMFGLFSKKINKTFKCLNCKYTW